MSDENFSIDNWATQARKGLIELTILNNLNSGERYGYHLVKELISMDGLGISEGTIYPLLSRLRKTGLVTTKLVESNEGPARKYYSLTPYGKKQLQLMNKYIAKLVTGIDEAQSGGDSNA